MPLSDLNKEEIEVVGQCLRAAVYGPFFEDSEFELLLGVPRSEGKIVADLFPQVDEFDDDLECNYDAWLVINNTLLNLLAKFNSNESLWGNFISATPQSVKRIYEKWRSNISDA